MNRKYEAIIRTREYWEKALPEGVNTGEYREMILVLFNKIDTLNERVYEASVRAEDAYQEIGRLRSEYQAQIAKARQLLAGPQDI